jgi:hypothetical protein
MKVVIINNHVKDYLGGSETQCALIAEELTNENINVIYYAVDGKLENKFISNYDIKNIKLNVKNIYFKLKTDKPDLIYWRYGKKNLLNTVITSKLLNIKFIFAVSGPSDYLIKEEFKFSKKSNFKKFLHFIYIVLIILSNIYNFFAFYLVDAVIYQLENQFKSVPCNSFYLIYNSAQIKAGEFYWHKKFIVWVSNIKTNKNPNYFVDLAKEYINSGFDFLMVGKIQDKQFDFLLGDKNCLPSNFYYLGEKSSFETNSIIKKSEFLIHTCNPEGFPNVFIQAWSLGKPTISLFYDPDSFIENNDLGFFSKNYKKFVIDTGTLLFDENLRINLGRKAFLFSKNKFNIKFNIKKFFLVFYNTVKKD